MKRRCGGGDALAPLAGRAGGAEGELGLVGGHAELLRCCGRERDSDGGVETARGRRCSASTDGSMSDLHSLHSLSVTGRTVQIDHLVFRK